MDERLRPWVTGIASRTFADDTYVQAPDTATTIVLCSASEGMHVVGPRDTARYYAARGGTGARRTAVRLTPGRAQALLDVPVDELVDRVVPLGELWAGVGGGAAGGGWGGAGGGGSRDAAALVSVVLERVASVDPGPSELVLAAARLLRVRGVAETARALHVSERQLRTVFTRAVGLSPKRFARVDRVRRVVARGGHGGWARVAAELGYFDQAHLIAEFRAVMGVPPGAYLKGDLPAATFC
ncbi:AraC family transcriptional regulator [Saccharothrix xinjiangensis]|uniref:Helix-turn-helix domain-containing protein n=1 Tax=Saccharothrix xinjiangensis TaxID=204798 RepID=A0ABV9YBG3_9PSEU